MPIKAVARPSRVTALVTGGAGFIGSQLCASLIANGERIRLLDSVANRRAEENLDWLLERYPTSIDVIRADLRDASAMRVAASGVDHIFHLADSRPIGAGRDGGADHGGDAHLAANIQGTLNVLEAARQCVRPPSIVHVSTSEVYGSLQELEVAVVEERYAPLDPQVRLHGVGALSIADCVTQYASSRLAAERSVLDYGRIHALRATVLRFSTVYGPRGPQSDTHRFIARFTRDAVAGVPVVITGDGLQVRDALFVSDAVTALEAARLNISALAGRVFNVGGGVQNAVTMQGLLERISRLLGEPVASVHVSWSAGEPRYFVADTRTFRTRTRWRARVGLSVGLASVCDSFGGFERRSRKRTATLRTENIAVAPSRPS